MSNLSLLEYIQNRSEATTGLFNQRLSVISANFAALNSAATISFPSGNTLSVFSSLDASGNLHAGNRIGVGVTPSADTVEVMTIGADSSKSDYILFHDPTGAKSSYIIGSRVGGTADGLNIYDASGSTMIASFSKQSIRFFQQVVGPVFDLGGALTGTYNAATFGTASQSTESRIQAAINQASIDGVERVYIPSSMYPYSASSMSFIYPVQMVREGGNWAVYDVQAYGASPLGSLSATSAIQEAITAVSRSSDGAIVFIPAGQYSITTTLSITTGRRFAIVGDGRSASKLRNNIVGLPARPCLDIAVQDAYYLISSLAIEGNNLTGASGNGHGIVLRNTGAAGTYFPQQVMIRDCIINFHRGVGQNSSGSSCPAAGIYIGVGTGEYINNTFVASCARGLHLDGASKIYAQQFSVDKCDNAAVFIENLSEGIGFTGCIFNGSGSGGTREGLVYTADTESLTIDGCRLKNGNPYLLNIAADGGGYNTGINLLNSSCEQLLSSSTAIAIGNSVNECLIQSNNFRFVNTLTDAVGIDVVQAVAGFEAGAISIRNNSFDIGTGGTILAGIRFNITSNRAVAATIAGNSFGGYINSGRTITHAIDLQGRIEGILIKGNAFTAGASGLTITNCIRTFSGNVNNLFIEQNSYRTFSGKITNTIFNAGAVPITVLEAGTLSVATGNTIQPGMGFFSEQSLGLYRSGVSRMGLSYGQFTVPDGSNTTPSIGLSSATSVGFYSSGVQTIAQSLGTLNLATNSVRLSMRTIAASALTASAANTNVAVNEVVFTIQASGASFAINSGGTTWLFNSDASAKNT